MSVSSFLSFSASVQTIETLFLHVVSNEVFYIPDQEEEEIRNH